MWKILFIAVMACFGACAEADITTNDVHRRNFHPFLALPSPEAVADMKRYYPLEKYRVFPRRLRPLLQRHAYEQDVCRSSPGENGARQVIVMESCNRADRALFLLEKQGWCWGGGWVSADDHWLRCANSGRAASYQGDTFSAAEIREERRKIENRAMN